MEHTDPYKLGLLRAWREERKTPGERADALLQSLWIYASLIIYEEKHLIQMEEKTYINRGTYKADNKGVVCPLLLCPELLLLSNKAEERHQRDKSILYLTCAHVFSLKLPDTYQLHF